MLAAELGARFDCRRSTWRTRRVMPSSSFRLTWGSSLISAMSVRRNSRSTCIGVSAITDAVLGPPSIAESSPKKSPGITEPDPLLAAHDLALAGQDDEERLPRVALADDRFARPEREDVGVGREAVQVALGEAGEHRHARQRRRGLPFGSSRRLLGPPVTHLTTVTRDAPCPAGSGSWREPTLPRLSGANLAVSSLVAPFERPLGWTHGCCRPTARVARRTHRRAGRRLGRVAAGPGPHRRGVPGGPVRRPRPRTSRATPIC